MEKFKEIILDVWREACRHIEIVQSVPQITKMLIQHIPLRQLLICQIDYTRSQIKTIAVGFDDQDHGQDFISKKCTKDQIEAVKVWHQKGNILTRGQSKSTKKLISILLPLDTGSNVLAGPLGRQDDLLPILLLIANPPQKFELRHIEMLKVLLEPFTIALENDFRFKETVKLREAAEADKKSLLVKLSRKEIGDTIIGANNGLKTVLERVELIARSDVPVLIFGETGTGKELISRAIHNRSERCEGPFIRVNCGAIPSELIDSQLFGHERGAFTGAVETRKGWFERADGGTLFLDEVGEMPLDAQVRLIRILQDGWMERVGGKNSIKVDVRIVLATNRDLASMVAQGKFREDLWYRIATFPIFLPPLRERLQDLKALSEHFAQRSAIRFGLPVLIPDKKDIKLLASYSWPGNIRELGAVIDRAALLGNGHRLEIAKALGWTDSYEQHHVPKYKHTTKNADNQEIESLDEITQRHIEAALIHCRGKIEGKNGAAYLLKINPHTLRGRMRKLGIDWSAYRS